MAVERRSLSLKYQTANVVTEVRRVVVTGVYAKPTRKKKNGKTTIVAARAVGLADTH